LGPEPPPTLEVVQFWDLRRLQDWSSASFGFLGGPNHFPQSSGPRHLHSGGRPVDLHGVPVLSWMVAPAVRRRASMALRMTALWSYIRNPPFHSLTIGCGRGGFHVGIIVGIVERMSAVRHRHRSRFQFAVFFRGLWTHTRERGESGCRVHGRTHTHPRTWGSPVHNSVSVGVCTSRRTKHHSLCAFGWHRYSRTCIGFGCGGLGRSDLIGSSGVGAAL